MTIDDVSDASHGARTRLALEQMHGKGCHNRISVDDLLLGENMATAEMLDEIHCMLRHLTGVKQEWRD